MKGRWRRAEGGVSFLQTSTEPRVVAAERVCTSAPYGARERIAAVALKGPLFNANSSPLPSQCHQTCPRTSPSSSFVPTLSSFSASSYPASRSWRTTADITLNWHVIMSIADENEPWYRAAGPGGWNDPDMLEIGNGRLTEDEERAHFSLWALMKAPLLIGCDVAKIKPSSFAILTHPEARSGSIERNAERGARLPPSTTASNLSGLQPVLQKEVKFFLRICQNILRYPSSR